MFHEKDTTRLFTQIVNVLRDNIPVFDTDYENHIVRAIVSCDTQAGPIAKLVFDDAQWLRWFIAIPAVDCNEPSASQQLLRIQCINDRLSQICFDDEHRQLDIRSRAYLPSRDIAEFVIPQIVRDVQNILEDEQLAALTQQKRAS